MTACQDNVTIVLKDIVKNHNLLNHQTCLFAKYDRISKFKCNRAYLFGSLEG